MATKMRLLAGPMVAAAVIAAAAFAIGTANAESNGGVRVMPLGDSITDGANVPGGYRIDLWSKLVAGGYRVDFVGSMFNGPSSLGDHDHEGHSGWTIAQIDNNIVNWLRTYTPRTILLHIGTNDMYGSDPAGAASRLSTLVDHITTQSPNAELFVATIIPLSCCDSTVRSFNSQVSGIVQSKAAAGKHVHLVQMYNALTTGDLAEGVHPNAGGYSKMATVWYNALLSVPGSLASGTPPPTTTPRPPTTGPTTAPTTTQPPTGGQQIVGRASSRCLDIVGAATTDGTALQLYDCHSNWNQKWSYTNNTLINPQTGKCVNVNGGATSNGTAVNLWTCNGSGAQKWQLQTNGNLVNTQSGKCLDATGQGTSNGTRLQIYTCVAAGQGNQQWSLR